MIGHGKKMAKSLQNLSKSIQWTRQDAAGPYAPRQVGCRYLFHGRVKIGQHRSVPLHRHPFWHIDIQVSGPSWLLTRGGRQRIGSGDVYFIPPGIDHGFAYARKPSDFLTLKVAVLGRDGGAEILFASQSRVLAGIRRALLEATPRSGAPSTSQQATIELLAAALIANCYPETDAPADSAPDIPLVAAIKLFVSSAQGRVTSVKAVARRMGYSISHVTARFRAAAGIPLKRYLDEERRRAAAWLMNYSDQSIGDVAQLLAFPDIYSFSRFFKRMTGKSPRDFRRQRGDGSETESTNTEG